VAKIVSQSKLREWQATDRIRSVAHAMNCVFRATSEDDYAIDGEIEVVVPTEDGKGLQTNGGIIKVQAKSGMSYVTRNTNESFWAKVELDDLQTWHTSNVPVLYIIYHPDDDKLYWKEVKPYIRNTPDIWQPPYRIEFNKANDEFTVERYNSLCAIAEVSPPRVSMTERERLFSNLLPILRMPRSLTCAPTTLKRYNDVMATVLQKRKSTQMSGNTDGWGTGEERLVPPFCIMGELLYTFGDLRHRDCELRCCCDTTKIKDVLAEEWIKNEANRDQYVYLLKDLLKMHLRRLGLWYTKDYRRHYFPKYNKHELSFTRQWHNIRTRRKIRRTVAKWYEYGRDRFWRHRAVNMEFKDIGGTWFLQIEPMYFFTNDGDVASDPQLVGPYTTRIKAREKNANVLNHVLFWSDVLANNKEQIELGLSAVAPPILVIDRAPLSGIANFAILDDPAVYKETDEDMQLSFLGLEDFDVDDSQVEDEVEEDFDDDEY
jgi:hypothetical protein